MNSKKVLGFKKKYQKKQNPVTENRRDTFRFSECQREYVIYLLFNKYEAIIATGKNENDSFDLQCIDELLETLGVNQ